MSTMPATLAACCLISALLLAASQANKVYDVIIVGGGIAGVTAARSLEQEGVVDFLLLEGRGELGGRMQHGFLAGYPVELGALWIQGVEDGSPNPMYQEAMKYHVEGVYSDWDDMLFYDHMGDDVTYTTNEDLLRLYAAEEQMYEHTEKLLNNPAHGDLSVRSALRWFGFHPHTPTQQLADYYTWDFEFAVEANLISAPFLDWTYDDFGEEDYLVTDAKGYSSLAKSVLVDSVPDWQEKVRLNTVVHSIEYTDGQVVVKANNTCYTAKKVIVTVSLGVLQNDRIQFRPQLPDWKWEVIHGFLFVDYLSVYLKFPPNITWFVPRNKEWIGFASQTRGYFPLWQNYNKIWPGSHILQATVTGNEARRLQSLTDDEVTSEAMSVLRLMFGADIPQPEQIMFSRLHQDPLFHGSYTSWPIGFTPDMHTALRSPLGPVYFAGEAYSERYYGYTHGAMLSGQTVAEQVAACLRDANQCPQPYIPPYTAQGCTYPAANNYNKTALLDNGSCLFA